MHYTSTLVTRFEIEPYIAHVYEHMIIGEFIHRVRAKEPALLLCADIHGMTYNSSYIFLEINGTSKKLVDMFEAFVQQRSFDDITNRLAAGIKETELETQKKITLSNREIMEEITQINQTSQWLDITAVEKFDIIDAQLPDMYQDLDDATYPVRQLRFNLNRATAEDCLLYIWLMPFISRYVSEGISDVTVAHVYPAVFNRTAKGRRTYITHWVATDEDDETITAAATDLIEELRNLSRNLEENVHKQANTTDWYVEARDIFLGTGIVMPLKDFLGHATAKNIDTLLSRINIELS